MTGEKMGSKAPEPRPDSLGSVPATPAPPPRERREMGKLPPEFVKAIVEGRPVCVGMGGAILDNKAILDVEF